MFMVFFPFDLLLSAFASLTVSENIKPSASYFCLVLTLSISTFFCLHFYFYKKINLFFLKIAQNV